MNQKRGGTTTLEVGPRALVAAAAVIVVAAGAAILVSRGGLDAGGEDPVKAVAPIVAYEEGTGVTGEGDPYIGRPDAPVTVVEYGDYQCPNCRQFATEVLPWLRQTWLGRGFVRVVYRDFAIRGEASVRAAEAAHCAGEQGRYWSYHDAAFAAQGKADGEAYSRGVLLGIASDLGLDTGAVAECLNSRRYQSKVETSTQFGYDQGFEGTPTFIVNGRVTQGAIPIDRWNALFQAYQADLGSGQAP